MKDTRKIIIGVVYALFAFTVLTGCVSLIINWIDATWYMASANGFWFDEIRAIAKETGAWLTGLLSICVFAIPSVLLFALTVCWKGANDKWRKFLFFLLKLGFIVVGIIFLIELKIKFIDFLKWNGKDNIYTSGGSIFIESSELEEYATYVVFRTEILKLIVCLSVMLLIEYIPLFFCKAKPTQPQMQDGKVVGACEKESGETPVVAPVTEVKKTE